MKNWLKVINIKYKNKPIEVVIYLSDLTDGDPHCDKYPTVSIKSMYEIWFLEESAYFDSREAATSFIKLYSKEMALEFFNRQIRLSGALDDIAATKNFSSDHA